MNRAAKSSHRAWVRAAWALVGYAMVGLGCAAEPAPASLVTRTASPVVPLAASGAESRAYAEPAPRPVRRPETYDPRLDSTIVLETWCTALGKAYCTHCMEPQYTTCMTDFMPACYAGRTRAMATDRTLRHVMYCSEALTVASCTAVSRGQLPRPCRALGPTAGP